MLCMRRGLYRVCKIFASENHIFVLVQGFRRLADRRIYKKILVEVTAAP